MLLQKRTKKSRKTYTQTIWCPVSRLNAGFLTCVTIEWEMVSIYSPELFEIKDFWGVA